MDADASLIQLLAAWKAAQNPSEADRIFEQLVTKIRPYLWICARSKGCNPNDIDDFLLKTLERIVEKVDYFSGTEDSQFRAWCRQILFNLLIDEYRKRGRRQCDCLPLDEIQKLLDAAASRSGVPISDEIKDVKEVLANLDEPCRRLLTLALVEGWTINEIAELLGKEYDAVRVALNRCAKKAAGQQEL